MSDSQSRLSPDQIRFLMSPIFGPALRQDPKAAKGNVYIPGNFVISQLNTAFCFDGWSFEVQRVERVHMEKYAKDGKDQFKALYLVEGLLTVRCQDGTTFCRSGIGTDEKTSSNMKDVVSLATKAALTDAIKNAAITIGRQFGLDTVRAGNDAGGVKINWKQNASGERPRPPTFAGLSTQIENDLDDDDGGENVTEGGVTYNQRTGEVVQDNRPAGDAGRPQEQQRGREQDRPQERPQERQEQRREPAPSQVSQSSSQNGPQQGGQGGGGSDQRREPAPSQGSGNGSQSSSNGGGQGGNGQQGNGQGGGGGQNNSGGQGGNNDRDTLVKSCREAYRGVMTSNGGAARAMDIFKRVAQAHNFDGAMPSIGRPQDQGGPSSAFLAEYLRELQKAVG